MAVETAFITVGILLIIVMVALGLYSYYIFPQKIGKIVRNFALSGSLSATRKEKAVSKVIEREFETMLVNENPAILEDFPESLEKAHEMGLPMSSFAGLLGGKLGAFAMTLLSKNTESETLKTIANVAGQTGIAESIITGIFNIFKSRRERQVDKPKGQSKPKDKGKFPEFT